MVDTPKTGGSTIKKRKTNPSSVPVKLSEADARKIIDEEADRTILYAWAVVLCALASRWDTSAERMMAFCEDVNMKSSKLRTSEEVTRCLEELEKLTGKPFPFYALSISHIRSKGDVERLRRRSSASAMHSMFALIADAINSHHLMEREELRFLFQKAYDIEQDFQSGELSIRDLQWVLEEEYGLCLVKRGTDVILERIEEQKTGCQESLV